MGPQYVTKNSWLGSSYSSLKELQCYMNGKDIPIMEKNNEKHKIILSKYIKNRNRNISSTVYLSAEETKTNETFDHRLKNVMWIYSARLCSIIINYIRCMRYVLIRIYINNPSCIIILWNCDAKQGSLIKRCISFKSNISGTFIAV